jgi:hypothetical protein
MGPGTGQGAPSRTTPMDTLRQLAGDVSEFLTNRTDMVRNTPLLPPAWQGLRDKVASGEITTQDYLAALRSDPTIQREMFDTALNNPFFGPMVSGIKAFHGTPHDFPAERLVKMPDGTQTYLVGSPGQLPDAPPGAEVLKDFPLGRFRLDKIGTGEGAQAYGHGVYAAQREGVARGYRDTLSGKNVPASNYFVNGGVLPSVGDVWQKSYDAAQSSGNLRNDDAAAIARQIQDWIERGRKAETFLRHHDIPRGYEGAYKAAIEPWRGVTYKSNPGRMYEVDINTTPDRLLDWDKPLSDQPKAVRDALAGLGVKPKKSAVMYEPVPSDEWARLVIEKYGQQYGVTDPMKLPNDVLFSEEVNNLGRRPVRTEYNPTGGKAFEELAGGDANYSEEASAALRKAGVDGIQYLDAGSRGAGDGTKNYVIFSDDIINVLRKYGILAPLMGAGAVEAVSGAPEQ